MGCRWGLLLLRLLAASANARGLAAVPARSGVGRCPSPVLRAPPPLRLANASTKWLVVGANTAAVLSLRGFLPPFLTLGSIGATYGTEGLKLAINQRRPDGAPFTDPGMPSSHALVSVFLAVGWAQLARSRSVSAALLAAAAVISVLRVLCGYHTYAQIAVGAVLGAATAVAWMALGVALLAAADPRLALVLVWSAYLGGSALFIVTKMAKWTGKYKAL